ncbi:MAG: hypothetical protein IJ759_00135 [Bacteroidales bacterium]|nr:hypothetical protein [Bacteroidales bacterium]
MEKEIVINGIRYRAVEEAGQTTAQSENRVKPTLEDYTTIKTYEDACEALGEEPLVNELQGTRLYSSCEGKNIQMVLPKPVIALMKLEVIAAALRGGRKKIDFTEQDWWYYPYFNLYTNKAIAEITEEEKKEVNLITIDASRVCAVGGSSSNRTSCGLGFVGTVGVRSNRIVDCGSRLSFLQRSKEIAEYFGKQFIELWAEYNELIVLKSKK